MGSNIYVTHCSTKLSFLPLQYTCTKLQINETVNTGFTHTGVLAYNLLQYIKPGN